MAYNASNENKEIIVTLDKNNRGDKVRVTKVTNIKSNKVSADVRAMYTDTNNEIQYGKAGIRIDSEMGPDVIVAMLQALGEDVIQEVLTRLDKE